MIWEIVGQIVVEMLVTVLSWRAWLCIIAMLVFALLLHGWGIWFIWPSDIFVVAVILGIILGICWDRHVG